MKPGIGAAAGLSWHISASLVLAGSWLIEGCASSSLPRIYVLSTPPAAIGDPRPRATADRLVIAAIKIPAHLDSTDIVTREGDYELLTSSTGRWGERLSEGIRAALESDLSARLPGTLVTTSRDLAPASRQLWVTISAFDVWADGRCFLVADWSVGDPHGTTPIPVRDSLRISSEPGAGTNGDSRVVISMAAVLASLADRIAASIEGGPHE